MQNLRNKRWIDTKAFGETLFSVFTCPEETLKEEFIRRFNNKKNEGKEKLKIWSATFVTYLDAILLAMKADATSMPKQTVTCNADTLKGFHDSDIIRILAQQMLQKTKDEKTKLLMQYVKIIQSDDKQDVKQEEKIKAEVEKEVAAPKIVVQPVVEEKKEKDVSEPEPVKAEPKVEKQKPQTSEQKTSDDIDAIIDMLHNEDKHKHKHKHKHDKKKKEKHAEPEQPKELKKDEEEEKKKPKEEDTADDKNKKYNVVLVESDQEDEKKEDEDKTVAVIADDTKETEKEQEQKKQEPQPFSPDMRSLSPLSLFETKQMMHADPLLTWLGPISWEHEGDLLQNLNQSLTTVTKPKTLINEERLKNPEWKYSEITQQVPGTEDKKVVRVWQRNVNTGPDKDIHVVEQIMKTTIPGTRKEELGYFSAVSKKWKMT